ncbi:MAG: hypothetical protein AB7O97_02110 [Planctomycetota bacterium]
MSLTQGGEAEELKMRHLIAFAALCLGIGLMWLALGGDSTQPSIAGQSEGLVSTGAVDIAMAPKSALGDARRVPPAATRHPLETSPALLGSRIAGDREPVAEPGLAGVESPDSGLLRVYKRVVDGLERTAVDAQNLDGKSDKHRLATMESLYLGRAVKVLLDRRQHWYYGPQEGMPQYMHLQSTEMRYWSTHVGTDVLVLELSKTEFPECFEYDRRVLVDR